MNHITFKSGYKYQLCETYMGMVGFEPGRDIRTQWIDLDLTGKIIIKGGYAWDGPSGPTLDTLSFMRGSLVHDALYQLIREGYLKPEFRVEADECLRRLCLEDGMSRVRAWWVYNSVRAFGGAAANPKHTQMPIVAPGR